jgi:hypothetical protein
MSQVYLYQACRTKCKGSSISILRQVTRLETTNEASWMYPKVARCEACEWGTPVRLPSLFSENQRVVVRNSNVMKCLLTVSSGKTWWLLKKLKDMVLDLSLVSKSNYSNSAWVCCESLVVLEFMHMTQQYVLSAVSHLYHASRMV